MPATKAQRRYIRGVLIPAFFDLFTLAGVDGIKVKQDAYDKLKQAFGYLGTSEETPERTSDFMEQCHAFASDFDFPIFDRSTPAFLLAIRDKELNVTLITPEN